MTYDELRSAKEYWDKRGREVKDEAEARGCKDLPTMERSILRLHALLKSKARKPLMLDVGCGSGQFTVGVADLFDFVVGLDSSVNMVKRCRSKPSNVSFAVGSATHLPFKSGVFDSVISVSLLQEIKPSSNVEKTIFEVSRCSKDRAFIFLTFWDTPRSSTSIIKRLLRMEGYKLNQSLVSTLRLRRYVKLWGERFR